MRKFLAVLMVVLCSVNYVNAAGWWLWNGSVDTDPLKGANWTNINAAGAWTEGQGPGWQDGLIVQSGPAAMPELAENLLWMTYPLQIDNGATFTVSGTGSVDTWASSWYQDVLSGGTLRITDNAYYRC